LPFFLLFLDLKRKNTLKKVGGQRFFTHSNRYCCIIKGQEKGDFYQKLKKEKEEWLKSLHLDENRIIDRTHKH
jgi:hypothetical protein